MKVKVEETEIRLPVAEIERRTIQKRKLEMTGRMRMKVEMRTKVI